MPSSLLKKGSWLGTCSSLTGAVPHQVKAVGMETLGVPGQNRVHTYRCFPHRVLSAAGRPWVCAALAANTLSLTTARVPACSVHSAVKSVMYGLTERASAVQFMTADLNLNIHLVLLSKLVDWSKRADDTMEMIYTTKLPTASASLSNCKSVWLFRLDGLVICGSKPYLNRMI